MSQADEPQKQKLKVDMDGLEESFDNSSGEMNYYLDKETGEVVLVTDETQSELDKIYEELDDQGRSEAAFEEALAKRDLHDWQKEAVLQAHVVQEGYGERFVRAPGADSRDGFNDMEDFSSTVKEAALRDRLEDALGGKGSFRRFKNVLERYPSERERWFEFRDQRTRERIMEWLEEEDIEPIL